MTPTTLAETILRDVPIRGRMNAGRKCLDELVFKKDVEAALSAHLDAAIAERAGEVLERRMDAYYYGFSPTGVDTVDKILGAVACAGKAYHHTEQWDENCASYDDHAGASPVDWIQNAGKEAADLITALLAQNAALQAQVREMALDVLAASGQAQEAYQAQLAAEAQIAALPAATVGVPLKQIGTGLYEQPAPNPAAIREAWEKAYWRMRSYAVHDNDCKLNKPPHFDGPCSCGLTAALEDALALIQMEEQK